MPRFSSIFLPFLVNQTQKHKHKLISSKKKNTNTNLAIDLPCQPNTKATNTNPATDYNEDEDVEKLLELFTKDHLMALIKKGVSKHPGLIEIVRELTNADPTHRKIFIHGLDWDTRAETFTPVFCKYEEIEDCKAVTNCVFSKSKGYALFSSSIGATLGRLSSNPRSRSAIAPPHGRDLWPHLSVADIWT